MSVSITDYGFKTVLLDGQDRIALQKNKGLDIPFEWNFSVAGTGDGSGGNVSALIDFSTLDPQMYYYITKIYTHSGTNNCDIDIYTLTDQWDLLYNPLHADLNMRIWNVNGVGNTFEQYNQLKRPLYLGRPRNADAAAGRLWIVWSTNTDTNAYNALLLGFASKQSIPLSTFPDIFL